MYIINLVYRTSILANPEFHRPLYGVVSLQRLQNWLYLDLKF